MRNPSRPRRPILAAFAAFVALVPSAHSEDPSSPLTFGTIERLDARLDKLIPREAKLEKLAEGFDWSEGPAWDAREGRLLFSDVPQNTVFQWKQGAGARPFLKPSGYTGTEPRGGEPGSNGLVFDPSGRLVLCQHGDRRVARLVDGKFVTLADRFDGKRFNSPNDATYSSKGTSSSPTPPMASSS